MSGLLVYFHLTFYVAGEWMAYHENVPFTSKWSVNFGGRSGSEKVNERRTTKPIPRYRKRASDVVV